MGWPQPHHSAQLLRLQEDPGGDVSLVETLKLAFTNPRMQCMIPTILYNGMRYAAPLQQQHHMHMHTTHLASPQLTFWHHASECSLGFFFADYTASVVDVSLRSADAGFVLATFYLVDSVGTAASVCVCVYARECELMPRCCHFDHQPPMAWVAWPQLALGAEAAWH